MCCPGCEAVAQTIVDSGLMSYYKHRTEPAKKAESLVPKELEALSNYDVAEIQSDFVTQNKNLSEVLLSVEGITCAACAWLIEKQLRAVKGLVFINVNTTVHRAVIRWDNSQLKLSEILKAIGKVGYQASPFQPDNQEALYAEQVKSYMRRIGLAGIATMQVMMFAIALYADLFHGMEEEFRQYFRWVSMMLATPVLLYSAQPFYLNAIRNIRNRTLGMDIPVSIALLGAYSASTYATFTGTGEVYFESISMFTFFLLLGRMLELRARRKASESGSNLLKLLPSMALLVDGEESRQVPAKLLQPGQVILIKPGASVPADGTIIEGESSLEESMLTGEYLPVTKGPEAKVFAGTVNVDSQIKVRVTAIGNKTLVADIVKLQDMAQASKPRIEIVADHISRYFVGALLIISVVTYISWHFIQPEDAFWITLAVLVATCPCALSLATPTALTCATASLSRAGVLVRRNHVLETLAKADRIVFDKTGTLTKGKFTVSKVHCFADFDRARCLALAAGIEQYSEHPIASAFASYSDNKLKVTAIRNFPGQGLEGSYGDTPLRLGNQDFCAVSEQINSDSLVIYLTLGSTTLAAFELVDELRTDAAATVACFNSLGLKTSLLSGDSSSQGKIVGEQLNMSEIVTSATPEQKLEHLKQLQQKGEITLMIGDGVNDAPVLSGAHVSVALGSGTDVAKNSADVILLGQSLGRLVTARKIAIDTRRIIRQNLAWSLGYNLLILPLAASGQIPPYIAAVGMSLSSLIVVVNSLRLLKDKPQTSLTNKNRNEGPAAVQAS